MSRGSVNLNVSPPLSLANPFARLALRCRRPQVRVVLSAWYEILILSTRSRTCAWLRVGLFFFLKMARRRMWWASGLQDDSSLLFLSFPTFFSRPRFSGPSDAAFFLFLPRLWLFFFFSFRGFLSFLSFRSDFSSQASSSGSISTWMNSFSCPELSTLAWRRTSFFVHSTSFSSSQSSAPDDASSSSSLLSRAASILLLYASTASAFKGLGSLIFSPLLRCFPLSSSSECLSSAKTCAASSSWPSPCYHR